MHLNVFKGGKNVSTWKIPETSSPQMTIHNLVCLYKKDNLFHMKIYRGSQI